MLDIKTGEIFKANAGEYCSFTYNENLCEISNEDMTDDEYKNQRVNLKSNTKLANYARDMRNLRQFVQFELERGKNEI